MENMEFMMLQNTAEFLETEDMLAMDREIYWNMRNRLFGTIYDWLVDDDEQEVVSNIPLTAQMRVEDMKKYLREVTLIKLYEMVGKDAVKELEEEPLETLICCYASILPEQKREQKMDSYSLLFLAVEPSFLNASGAQLWGVDPDEVGPYPALCKREDGSWDKVVSWIGADSCHRTLWLLRELESRALEVDQKNLSEREPVPQLCKKTSRI